MKEKKSSLLFIIPNFFFIEKYQKKLYYYDIPIGTLQLSSFLRKDLNVKTQIIDLRMESEKYSNLRIVNPNDNKLNEFLIKVLERNDIQEFDNIGINCYTSFQYLYTDSLARILKEEFADKTVIVGGYHPTAVPEDFSYKNAPYDYILRGESETILQDLFLNKKINGKNKVKKPQILTPDRIIDINYLPFPDYELYLNKYPYNDKYKYEIYMSRGCPYQCAFCAENYDFRSLNFDIFQNHFNKLIEILGSINKKQIKIGFADQSFDRVSINKKVLSFIIDKEYNERFTFSCQSRIESISNDIPLLKMLKKAGFVVGFGFETANKNLLLEMHKTKDPLKYVDMTKKIINKYKNSSGPYCRLNIVSGFPGENESSFNETIEFINKHALNENIQISPSLFSNYPNLFVYKNMTYYKMKFGTNFIKEWWKIHSNPFKNSVPDPSRTYGLKQLISDYKEKYISILNFFKREKQEIFSDLVIWKKFYNNWYEELDNMSQMN
ncbi:MAG: B12-binding domain-containing radical SAM protein [Promethearchaeota archaeon]